MEGLNLMIYLAIGCFFIIGVAIAYESFVTNNSVLEEGIIVTMLGFGLMIFFVFKSGMLLEDTNPDGSSFSLWQGLKGMDISKISGGGKFRGGKISNTGKSKRKRRN